MILGFFRFAKVTTPAGELRDGTETLFFQHEDMAIAVGLRKHKQLQSLGLVVRKYWNCLVSVSQIATIRFSIN